MSTSVSFSSSGEFETSGAVYTIDCVSDVMLPMKPLPFSFQVPGMCNAIWVRDSLKATPFEVPVTGAFQVCLRIIGDFTEQPLPPVIIKGNVPQGNDTRKPGDDISGSFLQMIIQEGVGMDISSIAPLPPYTKELVIASDLEVYNGYQIISASENCEQVSKYLDLFPGFEITFVLV